MLKVAIVEDEKEYVEIFKNYLAEYQNEIGEEINLFIYNDGIHFLDDCKIELDLVLMDIVMPQMDGLKTAQHWRKNHAHTPLIFITTMGQFAIKGYEVEAIDFLVKPISYALFKTKLNKWRSRLERKINQFYLLKTTDGIIKIRYDEIIYLETNKHYLYFHMSNGACYRTRMMMKEVYVEFIERNFAFLNGSLLVNLFYVKQIRDYTVQVGEDLLLCGRAYKKAFLEKLSLYLGNRV